MMGRTDTILDLLMDAGGSLPVRILSEHFDEPIGRELRELEAGGKVRCREEGGGGQVAELVPEEDRILSDRELLEDLYDATNDFLDDLIARFKGLRSGADPGGNEEVFAKLRAAAAAAEVRLGKVTS